MYNFTIGGIYTFDTVAPALLGTTIKNARLLALLDYEVAVQFDNIDVRHAAVRPLLPAGSAFDNPKAFSYLYLISETGTRIVLAYPWIKEETISKTTNQSVVITVNDATANDAIRIRQMLALSGYHSVSLEVKDITS